MSQSCLHLDQIIFPIADRGPFLIDLIEPDPSWSGMLRRDFLSPVSRALGFIGPVTQGSAALPLGFIPPPAPQAEEAT